MAQTGHFPAFQNGGNSWQLSGNMVEKRGQTIAQDCPNLISNEFDHVRHHSNSNSPTDHLRNAANLYGHSLNIGSDRVKQIPQFASQNNNSTSSQLPVTFSQNYSPGSNSTTSPGSYLNTGASQITSAAPQEVTAVQPTIASSQLALGPAGVGSSLGGTFDAIIPAAIGINGRNQHFHPYSFPTFSPSNCSATFR